MANTAVNPLLSTSRASDTSPTIQLHPLVLLTISDCITRHTLRQIKGPVAGAILGQQNGREVTMEVAFEAKLVERDGEVVLDDEWFAARLEQYKDVHKQPPLDLVGWFTLGPASGPNPNILPIHARISELYTESPILCLFHPADTASEATAAGKLPLTLYESVYESSSGGQNDKSMDIDGATQARSVKFRELVYSVETAEAEMIAVDFVARGGGNATAVNATGESDISADSQGKKGKGKGKAKEADVIDDDKVLTAEDEEVLSTLTAKINAIRMLGRRISLLRTYLDTLPPSYLTDPTIPVKPSPTADQSLLPNHSILRSISATLARINILSPPDTTAFTLESQQEASDVQLIALLSAMTNSIAAAKTFGATSYAVETLKSGGHKPPFPSRHPGSINVLRSDATPFFENGMLGEGLMGNVRDSSDSVEWPTENFWGVHQWPYPPP